MMNQLTNMEIDGTMVKAFEFTNAEGKSMIVHGDMAVAVSNFSTAEMLGKKAGLLKAISLYRFSLLDTEMLKEKYNVKTGKAFLTKFVEPSINGKTFDKDVLAVKNFLNVLDGNKYEYKFEEIKDYPIGKLIALNAYFAEARRLHPDDESLIECEAIENIKYDIQTGVITPYMTDAKFKDAIDKSLHGTVEEPKIEVKESIRDENKEPENKEPENKEPENKEPENIAKCSDMVDMGHGRAYETLCKVQLALEKLAEYRESKPKKLPDDVMAIITIMEDALKFTEETFTA